MRVLMDTHALIWAVDEPARLGSKARLALEDDSNEVVVKTSLRKLTLSMPYTRTGVGNRRDQGRSRDAVRYSACVAAIGAEMCSLMRLTAAHSGR